MKKFLLLLASAVSVILFAVSCKKEKAESVFVAVSSDSEFVDSKATLNFILSQAAPSDITISLAVLSSASEGNSAVAADKLTVPASKDGDCTEGDAARQSPSWIGNPNGPGSAAARFF